MNLNQSYVKDRERLLAAEKIAASVVGIPDMERYGEPGKSISFGELLTYVLQQHDTKRKPGYPHYDLRIGDKDRGLFSWAIPKGRLPNKGEKLLAVQTQIHSPDYADFQGIIEDGYGAGTVKKVDKGEVYITKSSPQHIEFTVAHGRIPVRYGMVKVDTDEGHNWLLMNVTPSEAPLTGKPKFKLIKEQDLEDALNEAIEVQEKIDGAHAIYEVTPKGTMEAYSVRPRTTGDPIVHTERLGIKRAQVPRGYGDTILRGEMYAVDQDGKAVPFHEIAGILNSTIAKSYRTLQDKRYKLVNAIFDIEKFKGENVTTLPYPERKKMLQEMLGHLPQDIFHIPRSETAPEEIEKMIEDIKSGRNPRTREGVIIHKDGKTLKYKVRPEQTVWFKGLYEGKKARKDTAGGFMFALEEDGEGTGRVGTGFNMQQLNEVVNDPDKFMNRPFKVEHRGITSKNKLREPSFVGWEVEGDKWTET